jgi:hypothetical protein
VLGRGVWVGPSVLVDTVTTSPRSVDPELKPEVRHSRSVGRVANQSVSHSVLDQHVRVRVLTSLKIAQLVS